jgi:hypothetical protein
MIVSLAKRSIKIDGEKNRDLLGSWRREFLVSLNWFRSNEKRKAGLFLPSRLAFLPFNEQQ